MTHLNAFITKLALFCLLIAPIKSIAETEKRYWDLKDLYPSVDAWDQQRQDSLKDIAKLPELQGTLGKDADSLLAGLDQISDIQKTAYRLYSYASLQQDEDQRQPDTQARFEDARQLVAKLDEATAWLSAEIIDIGADQVSAYIKAQPKLATYQFPLQDILRMAPHTLDHDGEALLSKSALVLGSPGQIYEKYANADIPWPKVTLSDGEEVELNQAGYSRYRSSSNREDRHLVFDTFWDTWQQYADGMGATLSAEVQANIFTARARNYASVLEQNLFEDGLPAAVFEQLVRQVHASLPVFHRYLNLRARMLGIDELKYYDIYPPLVEADTGVFDLQRSEEITEKALAPFGDRYLSLLEQGFSQQWVHSHPQPGKTSGAYMNGSAYDVHPYVLLNHNDDYNALSTFAHEWGHAVHSLLANEAQPFVTADYSTFIAEMASTINEILLEEYMIANAKSREEKLFYLGQALESIRGTLFRQTMFGEFEAQIHELAESGKPLTGSILNETYLKLLRQYHGDAEGVLTIDDRYGVEWAYIPHFYYDFYVFQYATSISGAAWFAEQFLNGDEAVKDAFIRVLSAGGSALPHDILVNEAGLDMTRADAYAPVMRRMTSLMDRIEALL